MTRVINFDKSFKITVPISLVIIIAGLIGARGHGLQQRRRLPGRPQLHRPVRAALDGRRLQGRGHDDPRSLAKADATFISRAPSGDSKSYTFAFAQYPTLQALADAFKTVPGVSVALKADGADRLQAPPRRLADRCPARR